MIRGLRKCVIGAVLIPIGAAASLVLAAALHLSAKNSAAGLMQFRLSQCLALVREERTVFLLFVSFFALSLLCVFMMLYSGYPWYESRMMKVTHRISTPVPAGQRQHGSARWLSKREVQRSFPHAVLDRDHPAIRFLTVHGQDDLKGQEIRKMENPLSAVGGGVVIGQEISKPWTRNREKIYYIGEDTHTLCVGATRSGKSRCVVLQSIGLTGLAGESMIVGDPKGELHAYTGPYLQRLGYEVVALDFKHPLRSHRCNLLQPVIDAVGEHDIPNAVGCAWDMTAVLVGEAKGERIWNDGEASVIASSILAVVYDNTDHPEYQNLTNVYSFISNMCRMDEKDLPLNRYMSTLSDDHPAKALFGIAKVAPSRTRGSFFTAALTTLRLFTNPLIHAMTCTSDFDLRTTGETKRALFIILPDETTAYYSLASLFVSMQYQLLIRSAERRGDRLARKVHFCLDEFGNFARIPDFANQITAGGGRGIRFHLFVQSLAQIDEKYGKENATTIKGNCATWIYLCADDPLTLEEMSKRLGSYTVATHSRSSSCNKRSSSGSSASTNLMGRALLTPDEVRLIDRPYSLITSRSHPALLYAPDITRYAFNEMFGLGDEEHNRMVRVKRESARISRGEKKGIPLWNIWQFYSPGSPNGSYGAAEIDD